MAGTDRLNADEATAKAAECRDDAKRAKLSEHGIMLEHIPDVGADRLDVEERALAKRRGPNSGHVLYWRLADIAFSSLNVR